MKKKIYLCMYRMLTLLAFVIISEYCIGGNNNRRIVYYQNICKEDYGLNGPVCSVVDKDYGLQMKFGEIVRTGSKDTHIYFYANGNVYKEVYSPSAYKKFQYDEQGYLTSEMTINIGSSKRSIWYKNERISDNDTTDFFSYENKYNSDGTIKEIKKYKVFHGEAAQTSRVVITNSSGIKKVTFYSLSGMEREDTYSNNKRISKNSTPSNVFDWTNYIDVYNKDGLVIQKTASWVMRNGSLFAEEIYKYDYDANKNIIKESIFESKQKNVPQKTITTKYIYDNHGNWTRKMQFHGSRLISWRERDIFYASTESDYNKIIDDDLTKERESKLYKAKMYYKHEKDSIAAQLLREKQLKDSLGNANRVRDSIDNEKSIIIASIFEKELLQKSIDVDYNTKVEYSTKYKSYLLKFSGIKNELKKCEIQGSKINFYEKKGAPFIAMQIYGSIIDRYEWNWDPDNNHMQVVRIYYSRDFLDILLYVELAKKKGSFILPAIILLHKDNENDNYSTYMIEKDAYEKIFKILPSIEDKHINKLTTKHLKFIKINK